MGRNLVLCSDGTGNTFDGRSTNITELVKSLYLDNDQIQKVVYDQGVGTARRRTEEVAGIPDQEALQILEAPIAGLSPLHWVRLSRGLMFGYGLKENVRQIYQVLAGLYQPDDRVFLFGFSRGAFTVRALAALLHRCWLPTDGPDFGDRFERAWDLLQPMEADRDAVEVLRGEHRRCPVHFLGVWDTVKSYGGLRPVILPHLRHNPDVAHVRHALALDERRAWFKPTTWGQLDIDRTGGMTRTDPADAEAYRSQDIREVWFDGCHSDIGGGKQEAETARIALRWMLGEAVNIPFPLLLNERGRSTLLEDDPSKEPVIHPSWSLPWKVLEKIPRQEIDNSGVYPRLVRHRGSDGERDPEVSRREGKVTIHSTARNRTSIQEPIQVCKTQALPD